MAAHLDLGAVGQLTGSLPPVYGNLGRAGAARDGVRGGAAAVKEGVNNRTVLGVVQQLVDPRHLVEENAAVAERDGVAHVLIQLQICSVPWRRGTM